MNLIRNHSLTPTQKTKKTVQIDQKTLTKLRPLEKTTHTGIVGWVYIQTIWDYSRDTWDNGITGWDNGITGELGFG